MRAVSISSRRRGPRLSPWEVHTAVETAPAIAYGIASPDLTANQTNAVEYRAQDACIVAGPGSGKTTVLVERYRLLVVERGFDPRHILAITFTEKAAANMKMRLAAIFARNPVLRRDLESAWVSTIHGFCARLIRENAIAAGIDPRFTVLDAREAEELQFECLNRAFDELTGTRRTEMLALIEALNTPYILGDLRTAYEAIRCAGKTLDDIRAMPGPMKAITPAEAAKRLSEILEAWPALLSAAQRAQYHTLSEWAARFSRNGDSSISDDERFAAICGFRPDLRFVPRGHSEPLKAFREDVLPVVKTGEIDRRFGPYRELIFEALAHFDQFYRESKTAHGALDFTDLETRAIDLLRENPDVRKRVQREFRQVMLDEFQDINRQQWDLIELVRGGDVFFAVGDVNQSIYGFRHACPAILDDYRAEIEASGKHSAALLDNFRSRPEILSVAEELLSGAEGIQERELKAGKTLISKSAPSIEILRIEDDDKDAASLREARWICHRILALRGSLEIPADPGIRMADFGDFSVLCRNGDSMKPILEEFDFAGIPYICGRRQSFLLSREGRDITALLRTIANPRDSIALATVLRSPLVGIGDEGLLQLRLLAGSLTRGLNIVAQDPGRLADFNPHDAAEIERFAANLRRWRAGQPVLPLDVLIVRVLKDCGFEWRPGSNAGTNIENFLQLARKRVRPLTAFLREIESLENAVTTESDLSDADKGDRVQVMTTHAAKGLEFPVTIIAAMDRRPRSESAPVTFTPEGGLGLKWRDPSAGENLEDSWQARNKKLISERETQESHRLLYVAMTRAEEHLILSYSRAAKDRRSDWARCIDEFFRLDGRPPGEPWIEEREAIGREPFRVSITVTGEDPPEISGGFRAIENPKEVIAVPPHSAPVHHDSIVNVTGLASFADCPRKYYIERYIGWNANGMIPEHDSEKEREVPAAELGSLVHEILAGKTGDYPAEAHQLADVFRQSDLGRRADISTRRAHEWEFISEINGSLLRGTIDLWFEDSGEIHIVDFKTDDVNASQIARRADRYSPQIALYALALERALGKRPAKAWLHFLRLDALIEVPIDEATLESAKDLVSGLRGAQNELKFDPREGEHCKLCSFRGSLCPVGR